MHDSKKNWVVTAGLFEARNWMGMTVVDDLIERSILGLDRQGEWYVLYSGISKSFAQKVEADARESSMHKLGMDGQPMRTLAVDLAVQS